jgi:hypothetical protein
MRNRLLLLLLLPALLLTMALRQAPLVNPPPIAVPAKASPADVAKAIKGALINRHWVVSSEKPGVILAALNVREHTANIEIDFDRTDVRIKYVSSVNLKYEMEKGSPVIHKNYIGWVQFLASDISGNLQAAGM